MVNTRFDYRTATVIQRPSSARRAALEKRQEEIRKKLADMDARERAVQRKLDTRRKIIVGAAVLGRAGLDPQFAAQLRQLLDEAVKEQVNRAVIQDLLEPTTPRSEPAMSTASDSQTAVSPAPGP
ncbi:hypothetical protein LMG28614_05648 [Paraburkholderia ultramafica]|uniref:Mobilization protein n=1 Tax=Paraburkholderia ultramafica TaxID=1544867 RepID=A0A6S7BJI0_9BURK|nr:hypothetical protein [Paraburkholderia ultramafica]CAB3802579.1 hypothetical protein LMG28614_05648 [Paraburkholderia ultramafica]